MPKLPPSPPSGGGTKRIIIPKGTRFDIGQMRRSANLRAVDQICFLCGGVRDSALLSDQLVPSGKRDVLLDKEPCKHCLDLMETGALLIEQPDCPKSDKDRTGRMFVVPYDQIKKMVKGKALERLLVEKYAFVQENVLKIMGFE